MFYSFKRLFLKLSVFLFIFPVNSWADYLENKPKSVFQPIQEMFQSNLVYPQEKDEVQVTFFPSFIKNTNFDQTQTLFEIEYGITDAFQLIFEWDGFLYKELDDRITKSGPGNIEFGAQYSFMAIGDGNTHFSLGTLVELPVGPERNGLNEGHLALHPFAVLARDFPNLNQSQIFIELGYKWVDQVRSFSAPDNAVDSFIWNFGAFLPYKSWRATMEINGKTNELDGGKEDEIFLTPGVIYKIAKNIEIGVGTPIGITDNSDDYRVVGYFMWEFDIDD